MGPCSQHFGLDDASGAPAARTPGQRGGGELTPQGERDEAQHMGLRLLHPPRRALLGAGLMVAGLGFLALAVSASATVGRLDSIVSWTLHLNLVESVLVASYSVTTLGGTHAVLILTAVAAACLAALRHWTGAAALALSVLATQAAVALVKGLVARPRPAANESLAEAAGWSFPSGHSATSIALFATLALIVARHRRGASGIGIMLALASLILAIGLSRVYLGAHYPTDVLGGWLLGGALVASCWALASGLGSRSARGAAT